MKKVLFALQTLTCGGVEKELIEILKKIDHTMFSITVLIFYSTDLEIESEISNYAKIVNLNINKSYYCGGLKKMVFARLAKCEIKESVKLLICKMFKIGTNSTVIDLSGLPKLNNEYDVAICFHMHSSIVLKYVATMIRAKKKIVWIHSDFCTTKYPIEKLKNNVIEYHTVVAVSKKVLDEFNERAKWYSGVKQVIYNYLNIDDIIRKSYSHISEERFVNNDDIVILSVGRFDDLKNFELSIKTSRVLKDKGIKFKWLLIGWGEKEKEYNKLVKKYSVEDCFIILGRKSNPYPYFKMADYYVQTSKSEAYCITVKEARIFAKPIVCTDFAGVREQIRNGENGIIVPLNASALVVAENIIKLIEDKILRETIIQNLKKSDFDNDGISKIEEMLNS